MINKLALSCVVVAGLGSVLLAQAPTGPAPIASSPVAYLRGKVAKVDIVWGQGAPSLLVDQGGTTTRVILGSMRYLVQQNFNPKVGEEVDIKGYKAGDVIVASSVTLVGENQTLKLRDDNGWPLWMGGAGGRGRGGPGGRGGRMGAFFGGQAQGAGAGANFVPYCLRGGTGPVNQGQAQKQQ
jgi:hypothetical protein